MPRKRCAYSMDFYRPHRVHVYSSYAYNNALTACHSFSNSVMKINMTWKCLKSTMIFNFNKRCLLLSSWYGSTSGLISNIFTLNVCIKFDVLILDLEIIQFLLDFLFWTYVVVVILPYFLWYLQRRILYKTKWHANWCLSAGIKCHTD